MRLWPSKFDFFLDSLEIVFDIKQLLKKFLSFFVSS